VVDAISRTGGTTVDIGVVELDDFQAKTSKLVIGRVSPPQKAQPQLTLGKLARL